ncbi:hypothetical protein FB451DRAFT_1550703 [Mycena latifolia]|nr:hypothetical protein FB451DRAFT_1550703 [Mycena latifolia]
MHIPFAVFISLALALPTLAAPVVLDVETQDLAARHAEEIAEVFAAPVPAALVGDASALEARTKTKTKVAAKPKAAPKAEPAPKEASAKVAPKPAAKPPVKAKVPVKPATKVKPPTKAPVKPDAKPPTTAPVKSAAKPPVKSTAAKPPAEVPSKAATGKAPANSACKIPKKGTSTNETATPKTKAKKGPRRLLPRTVRHPSATNTISLFHGTTATNAAKIDAQGPLISITPKGDFNSEPGVDGGFYLTDSLITAAQFACHEQARGSPPEVDVLEFTWHGSSSVHEFPGETQEWLSFVNHNLGPDPVKDAFHPRALEIFQNDMISGPMKGPDDFDLTDDFFQYAVVKQAAADTQLTPKRHHRNILCANVPKGNSLTDAQYTGTQGGNSQLNTILATLKQALCTIPEEDEEEE